MHYYVEPQGILGLIGWLPFNVARAVRLNLAVIWIALTWISFSVFALPYLGIGLSKRYAHLILGLTLVGGLGIVLGILASYNQLIPSPWWFIFGAQGKPNDVNQGAFWLLWVAAVLFYGSYLFSRAINTSPEPVRPLVKILSIALAGTGAGLVFGALPAAQPFPTFTEDRYFSWIMIHALVGFWPAIITSILLILLVLTGVVPPTLAVIVGSVDAAMEIVTGMIGTAHRCYFGGEPVFWMYSGAAAARTRADDRGPDIAGFVHSAQRRRRRDRARRRAGRRGAGLRARRLVDSPPQESLAPGRRPGPRRDRDSGAGGDRGAFVPLILAVVGDHSVDSTERTKALGLINLVSTAGGMLGSAAAAVLPLNGAVDALHAGAAAAAAASILIALGLRERARAVNPFAGLSGGPRRSSAIR